MRNNKKIWFEIPSEVEPLLKEKSALLGMSISGLCRNALLTLLYNLKIQDPILKPISHKNYIQILLNEREESNG